MPREIVGGFIKCDAEPWTEGKIVAGILKSVDTLPSKGDQPMSRKILFETSPGQHAAVWETGYLARQVAQMKLGEYYIIRCKGKTADTQYGVKAWEFEVLQAENGADITEFSSIYGKYVAGGGK